MAMLFDRDVKTIGKHIANAPREELDASDIPTVAKFATVQMEGNRQVERDIEYYNLDVIMSVGYRVIEFRRWATDVLRHYIINSSLPSLLHREKSLLPRRKQANRGNCIPLLLGEERLAL